MNRRTIVILFLLQVFGMTVHAQSNELTLDDDVPLAPSVEFSGAATNTPKTITEPPVQSPSVTIIVAPIATPVVTNPAPPVIAPAVDPTVIQPLAVEQTPAIPSTVAPIPAPQPAPPVTPIAKPIIAAPAAKGKPPESKFAVEIIGGGLTYHIIAGDSEMYSNKVSGDGALISNALYGLGLSYYHEENYYITGRFFKGNNSIHEPINGGTLSGGSVYKYLDVGIIIGGYFQNDYKYLQQGLEPFSLTTGSNALVPIIGVELNPKIPLGDRFFIKMNNILTPIITNHTLAIGMYFP